MNSDNGYMKLRVFAFGMAFGIVNGLGMMLFAWAGWLGGYGLDMINTISSVYYGYAPTLVGGLIGAAWGFLDAFVFAAILAWIYNKCLGCNFCCKK